MSNSFQAYLQLYARSEEGNARQWGPMFIILISTLGVAEIAKARNVDGMSKSLPGTGQFFSYAEAKVRWNRLSSFVWLIIVFSVSYIFVDAYNHYHHKHPLTPAKESDKPWYLPNTDVIFTPPPIVLTPEQRRKEQTALFNRDLLIFILVCLVLLLPVYIATSWSLQPIPIATLALRQWVGIATNIICITGFIYLNQTYGIRPLSLVLLLLPFWSVYIKQYLASLMPVNATRNKRRIAEIRARGDNPRNIRVFAGIAGLLHNDIPESAQGAGIQLANTTSGNIGQDGRHIGRMAFPPHIMRRFGLSEYLGDTSFEPVETRIVREDLGDFDEELSKQNLLDTYKKIPRHYTPPDMNYSWDNLRTVMGHDNEYFKLLQHVSDNESITTDEAFQRLNNQMSMRFHDYSQALVEKLMPLPFSEEDLEAFIDKQGDAYIGAERDNAEMVSQRERVVKWMTGLYKGGLMPTDIRAMVRNARIRQRMIEFDVPEDAIIHSVEFIVAQSHFQFKKENEKGLFFGSDENKLGSSVLQGENFTDYVFRHVERYIHMDYNIVQEVAAGLPGSILTDIVSADNLIGTYKISPDEIHILRYTKDDIQKMIQALILQQNVIRTNMLEQGNSAEDIENILAQVEEKIEKLETIKTISGEMSGSIEEPVQAQEYQEYLEALREWGDRQIAWARSTRGRVWRRNHPNYDIRQVLESAGLQVPDDLGNAENE